MKTFKQFIAEAKPPKDDALETIVRNHKRRTPGMKFVAHYTNSGDARVDHIETPPEHRGKGTAERALHGVHAHARRKGINVSLTPVAFEKPKNNQRQKGLTKTQRQRRLVNWYKELGYRKRRVTDNIAGADSMIRTPDTPITWRRDRNRPKTSGG